MKIVLNIIFLASIVLCEVPPPYPSSGFRPNPSFNLPVRRPETIYGVPNNIPSQFSRPSLPQQQYNVPTRQIRPQSFPSKVQIPSTSYGVPSSTPLKLSQLSLPQQQYNTPNRPSLTPNFSSKQQVPSTSYGVPAATSTPYRTIVKEPQVVYGAPNREVNPPSNLTPNFNSKQQTPSAVYGPPPPTISPYRTIITEQQGSRSAQDTENRPSLQYGTPGEQNLETLEQIKQLNLLLQLSQSSKSNQQNQFGVNLSESQNSNRNINTPNQEYLPSRGINDGFQPQDSQEDILRNVDGPNQQYLPSREGNNAFQNENSQGNVLQVAQQPLPVKEASDFRNGFDVPQNFQEPFDGRIADPNLQRPSQQYLPLREASNFAKGVGYIQTNPQSNKVNIQRNLLPLEVGSNVARSVQNPRQGGVEIQQLNVKHLQSIKTNKSNSKSSLNQVQSNREFGDSNIQSNREQIDDRYLPPTTVRTVQRPTKPSVQRPTSLPTDDSDDNKQPPETDQPADGPNVAVATAVAGVPGQRGQSFYLLQPDGTLQRVIYQKTRTEADRENEYTANYLFQDVQPSPGLVYSPLIAVGKR